MGDIRDLSPARQGLDHLKSVASNRWDVELKGIDMKRVRSKIVCGFILGLSRSSQTISVRLNPSALL